MLKPTNKNQGIGYQYQYIRGALDAKIKPNFESLQGASLSKNKS